MAMEEMNLQLFAEADAQDSLLETTASVTPEKKEAPPVIPDELDGVSPDIAREIMKEAEERETKEAPASDDGHQPAAAEPEAQENTEVDAEADSDTKPVEDSVLEAPKQPIPYARFKQVNDKLKAVEKQLKEFQEQREKEKSAPSSASQPTQSIQGTAMAPNAVPASNPPSSSFTLTPEIAGRIDAAAKAEALRMTGMTQEEVDNLAYADDDDTKRQTWNTAVAMSRNLILGQIQQEAQRQQQRQMLFMQQHQQLMKQYQDFASKEMQADDFAAIQQYAVNDFFQTKNPTEQQIIGSAYARIERNIASPAEVYSVVNYFKEAKEAYQQAKAKEKQDAAPAKTDITKTKQKIVEANKQPRSQQLEGAASTDGKALTVASLQHLLETTPWEKIPDEYKQILLNGSFNS